MLFSPHIAQALARADAIQAAAQQQGDQELVALQVTALCEARDALLASLDQLIHAITDADWRAGVERRDLALRHLLAVLRAMQRVHGGP